MDEKKRRTQDTMAVKSFSAQQAALAGRIRSGELRVVMLDPDGTLNGWLAVVVQAATRVVYATQCAGLAAEQRFIEGYLVLLGGSTYDPGGRQIDVGALVDVFHDHGACVWTWSGRDLPADRLGRLKTLVAEIPFWRCGLDGRDAKFALRMDHDRIDELAEAWVPVDTPDGPGVLLYKNCD